mmetsp:Transcript_1087/g.2632  ORF Transcript_1087/g.2632 Transcript_1087/m.2632 type:complete len:236 (-) Transcript_1087:62-769(-)|eukprot:CAMPEP_0183439932 /NCGR_PEP_ID=MMETSP0370-20130417/79732_1 /TAXON_ID=268820 /ORGANISM="Peridinium aciculiferum, Strain PAER-2" /LENGTH=235 /DNA_ID=CAMNT_0025628583 /DNA_START=66 /DNA_END=773 /DNA_ORIENTATION=+
MAASMLREAQMLPERFRFLLASASPRRRELLALLGLPLDVMTSGFAEDLETSSFSTPAEYVRATATGKCEAVLETLPGRRSDGRQDVVICADTVVTVDGNILEKPVDDAHARAMLRSLSGRTHEVFTAIIVAVKGRRAIRSSVERTEVTFSELSDEEIDAYIETREPFDKAGGYGIQSKGSLLVKGINGDYFNVVGLPIAGLAKLLLAELSPPLGEQAAQADGPPSKRRKDEGLG